MYDVIMNTITGLVFVAVFLLALDTFRRPR